MEKREDELSVDVLSDLLASAQGLIENADNKSRFLLTANGFMTAALSLGMPGTIAALQPSNVRPLAWVLVVFEATLIGGIFVSTLCAFLTLRPRIRFGEHPSPFLFTDIAQMESDQFIEEFKKLGTEDLRTGLLRQLHACACIVTTKFDHASRSTSALTVALLAWLGVQIIRFFL